MIVEPIEAKGKGKAKREKRGFLGNDPNRPVNRPNWRGRAGVDCESMTEFQIWSRSRELPRPQIDLRREASSERATVGFPSTSTTQE